MWSASALLMPSGEPLDSPYFRKSLALISILRRVFEVGLLPLPSENNQR
jgi:hypothetical protein